MKDPFDKRRPTKLSHELDRLASSAERGEQAEPAGAGHEDPGAPIVQVVVEIAGGSSSEAVEAEIHSAGGRILAGTRDLVRADIPASALRRVGERKEVLFVRSLFEWGQV